MIERKPEEMSDFFLPILLASQARLAFPWSVPLWLLECPVLAPVRLETQIGPAGVVLALACEYVSHVDRLLAAPQPAGLWEPEPSIRVQTEGLTD